MLDEFGQNTNLFLVFGFCIFLVSAFSNLVLFTDLFKTAVEHFLLNNKLPLSGNL